MLVTSSKIKHLHVDGLQIFYSPVRKQGTTASKIPTLTVAKLSCWTITNI